MFLKSRGRTGMLATFCGHGAVVSADVKDESRFRGV